MKLFGTSGIRGIVNKELIHLTLNVGLAVGKYYGRVVVGSDTRSSSPAMKHAFVSGLLAAGASAYDAGVIPTPTLALAAGNFDAGAVITASHNPPEYNGIKLWNPDGSAFDSQQRQQIEEAIAKDASSTAPWQEIKCSSSYHRAIEQHIERILMDFPAGFDLKVVVDCGCGAASVITPYLLRRLGCDVVSLNCYPDGSFPRPSEPTESNLGDLMKATRELGADLGIAHDGDADRMMLVDDEGQFIPGDKLLVLFAKALQAKSIITTIDASRVIEETGFAVTRTQVGDSYVSTALKGGGDFGGEPSGSWIFPGVSFCPDGIYAAALAVKIASEQKLSSLAYSLPSYPLLRGSVPGNNTTMPGLQARLMALEPVSASEVDGIKLSFHDGWLLVRASGTEPKIRLTVEAKTETRAQQLFDQAVTSIKGYTG
jgi:phosphoglucosamine mutase